MAVVTIRKASNMRVVILAVYINTQGGKWTHFFPTYEHLYGLKNDRLFKTMDRVDEENARIHKRDWEDRPNKLQVVR